MSSLQKCLFRIFAHLKKFFLIIIIFLLLIPEGEEGGRGERKESEKNIDVRGKHRSVASYTCPNWGLNLHPGHVPCLGIEPVAVWFAG